MALVEEWTPLRQMAGHASGDTAISLSASILHLLHRRSETSGT